MPGGTYGIADDGVVVGDSSGEAARWDADGTITDLGALPGDTKGYAYGINADGVIVGSSSGPNGTHPVGWGSATTA